MPHQPLVVGVVGLGSLGEPLLALLHAAGHQVIGVDRDRDVLDRVARRLKAAGRTGSGGPFTLGPDTAPLSRADLVIEAVSEDPTAKSELLQKLGALCPEHSVLVTTTAGLPLTALAVASARPTRTLGLRFLAPPGPDGTAEPVATAMSSAEAVTALEELVATLGLRRVAIGARAGADASALVHAYLNRAVALLEQGYATRDGIDTAMRLGCGLPAGPLETLDRIGLDTAHATLTALERATGDPVFRPAPLLERMVRQGGSLGRKSGAGFHCYDDLGEVSDAAGAQQGTAGSRPVRRVGVVGSGVMARGIAEIAAVAGFPTVLVARSRAKARQAQEGIAGSLTRAVRRGRITADARTTALLRLEAEADFSTLAGCDLVVEAVAEDPALKASVFAALGAACGPGTVLATATSSLPVGLCADSSGRAHDVVGLHFFNPAPAMRLVELARTPATGDDTAATARAFCARLGKTTVECPDRTGFVVNYLLFPYLGDAMRLLDRYDADVAEIDAAVELGFGYPMGPFTLLDTIGLDVSLAIMSRLHSDFPAPDFAPPPLLRQLVAQDCLGRKTGQGFRQLKHRV